MVPILHTVAQCKYLLNIFTTVRYITYIVHPPADTQNIWSLEALFVSILFKDKSQRLAYHRAEFEYCTSRLFLLFVQYVSR